MMSAGFTFTNLSFIVAVSAIFRPVSDDAGIAVPGDGDAGEVWARAEDVAKISASAPKTRDFDIRFPPFDVGHEFEYPLGRRSSLRVAADATTTVENVRLLETFSKNSCWLDVGVAEFD
ncbi:hypothetical protein JCM2811A_19770 [Methylorubrum rhodinum]